LAVTSGSQHAKALSRRASASDLCTDARRRGHQGPRGGVGHRQGHSTSGAGRR
jgi:hypothetical protein